MTPQDREPTAALTKKDFQSDQEVRWCPGCGDYAILKAVQSVLPTLGVPKEKFVFVSGIGCSSRFPYYMNTFGFHGIHGRGTAIATGIKAANPDLEVWVITGDGDGLSIGGNHFIHLLRRNIDIKVLLFNNRIYGLTKGQFSPTSEKHKVTRSTPFGSIDRPFNPIALALGAGATFVARSVDIYAKHLQDVLSRAAHHQGSAFVEIYQNCNIFNDGAFDYMTAREIRGDNEVDLQHGKPLVFGRGADKGIRAKGCAQLEVVELGGGVGPEDLLVHDESATPAALAYLLSQIGHPEFPTPIGVFRCVQEPTFESDLHGQIRSIMDAKGEGNLEELLRAGDIWTVP